MRRWYRSLDLLPGGVEQVIPPDSALESTVTSMMIDARLNPMTVESPAQRSASGIDDGHCPSRGQPPAADGKGAATFASSATRNLALRRLDASSQYRRSSPSRRTWHPRPRLMVMHCRSLSTFTVST